MISVSLTYPTPDGTRELAVGGRLSLGRGSEADQRFDDGGLSRLHATIYNEHGRVWIVDENSSNGTFVNDARVTGAGTELRNGDSIKIGNDTVLKVRFVESIGAAPATAVSAPTANAVSGTASSSRSMFLIAAVAAGFVIISISAVVIGFKVFGNSSKPLQPDVVSDYDDIDKPSKKTPKESPSSSPAANDSPAKPSDDQPLADSPTSTPTPTVSTLPAGKKYLDLSDSERRAYLADHAMRIAQIIGNRSSETIPPQALDKIKGFIDAYASRVRVPARSGQCRFADNLQATFERASKNAPFIVRAFNEKGTDPRIGLYLAMIESEHCVCLQSPTGPLGMFQFTYATAKLHFASSDSVIKGASVSNPDDRCKPEPSARAAASYMKALTGRYGTGPSSVPLAIGSYNSGEGGLSSNLTKALESNSGLPRDFWTLIANGDKLSKQFQSENFKYVPKFFAAAIIGENPQDFGLNLQPISTYTK